MADYLSTDPGAGETLQGYVSQQASAAGLDPAFVTRLVQQESGFNPSAVSPKGAQGLMQLLPETAKQYGATRLLDPVENVRAGLAHLKYLDGKFGGDKRLVAAAYNAGEGAVHKAGGIPDFPETKQYVEAVAPQSAGYLSTDSTSGDYLSTDPTAGSTSAGDQKKAANIKKYAQANPSLWAKIVDTAKGSYEGARAMITSPEARAAFVQSAAQNPVTQAGLGAVKSALRHVDTMADSARRNIPGVAELDTLVPPVALPGSPVLANRAQKVGAGLETAAEYALPLGVASNATKAVVGGAGIATRMAAQAAAQGATAAGMAHMEGDNPLAAGVAGAVGGAAEPVVEAVAPALAQAAVSRMRSAVKAGRSVLSGMPKTGSAVFTPFNQRAVALAKYILDNDLTPQTAQRLVEQLVQQLQVARATPSAQVAEPAITQEVTDALQAIATKYGHSPVSADLQAAIDKLYTMKPGPPVMKPSAILGPNGKPIMTATPGPPVKVARTDVTRDEALQIGQDMGKMQWGERGTPAQEAGKAVESTLRAAARRSPDIAEAQAPLPMAISAAKALDLAATRIGNREAVSPFTHVMDVVALAGAVGAPYTGGASLLTVLPSVISRYTQKHPMEAARMMRSLSDALIAHNIPLITKILTRTGVGAAAEAGGAQ